MKDLDALSRWAQTINWDAWASVGTIAGALGSFAAVTVALMASGRSAREARRKDIAALVVVSSVANGLKDMLRADVERLDTPEGLAMCINHIAILRRYSTPQEVLRAFDASRLPTREAVDQYMILQSQIGVVVECAHAISAGRVPPSSFKSVLEHADVSTESAAASLAATIVSLQHPTHFAIYRWLDRIDPDGKLRPLLERLKIV